MRNEKAHGITCIVCPVACKARLIVEEGEVLKIENLQCKRGEEYVLDEFRAPVRDFFTTVRVVNGKIPVLPVRSTQPISRSDLMRCASELAKVKVAAPVKRGKVVIGNILGLGVDIIATREIERQE